MKTPATAPFLEEVLNDLLSICLKLTNCIYQRPLIMGGRYFLLLNSVCKKA